MRAKMLLMLSGIERWAGLIISGLLVVTATISLTAFSPLPIVQAAPALFSKTVEYMLGQRTDPLPLAAGDPWSPGATLLHLPEEEVRVLSAWMDLHAQAPATPPADVSSISMIVNGSEYSSIKGRYTTHSGESCIIWATADVTGALQDFASPFSFDPVITIEGATSQSHSLKLFITYQYDGDSLRQLKTVRYPLPSRTAQLAAGNTHSIAYAASIPESGVELRSWWFEVSGQAHNANSMVDSFITASIGGGPPTPAAYVEMQERDTMDIRFLLRPAGFALNTPQTLNLTAGGQAFNLLGGELVATYEYDASSGEQLKTVSYFLGQSPGGNTTPLGYGRDIDIPESGVSVKGLWLRLRANASANVTHRVNGYIGGTAVGQRNYAVSANVENIGEHRIIYDMTSQAFLLANKVNLRVNTWYSAATGGPCGIEAFITYSYNRSSDFQLKTMAFPAGQSPEALNPSLSHTFGVVIPESGNKSMRSAYIVSHIVSSATAPYAHALEVNGSSPSSVTMADTGEANSSSRLYQADQIEAVTGSYTVLYSSTANAAWQGRCVLTYEVERVRPIPVPPTEIKTVEYCLGQRQDPDNLAAGTPWTPPPTTVYLPEEQVQVEKAWLEFRAQAPSNAAANVSSVSFAVNGIVFPAVPDNVFFHTGESGILWLKCDITAIFHAPGSSVVLSPSVTINGANSQGHSLRLVLTYASSAASAQVQRTVRFPLDSRTSFLNPGQTAAFPYRAEIPENGLVVRSQWFEVRGQAHNGNSPVDSFIAANIDGGPVTANAYAEMQLRDSMDILFLLQPSGFVPNADQVLNLIAGGQRFHVLGGELVVTYTCDDASPRQVKTVAYYLGQSNASTNPVTFTGIVHMPEAAVSVSAVWAHLRGNTSVSMNQSISASVAGNPLPQRDYLLTANMENIGEHRIIYDMTSHAPSLADGSEVSLTAWYTAAGGGAFGAELYVTYSHERAATGTQVKTVQFWVGQSSSQRRDSSSFRFRVWMPESDRIMQGAWLESAVLSNATSAYFHDLDIDGSGQSSMTMANTGEASSSSRLYRADQVGDAGAAYTCNAFSSARAAFSTKLFLTYQHQVPLVSMAIDSMYDIDGNLSQFGEMRFLEVDPVNGTYTIGDDEPYAIRLKARANTNWQISVRASGDFSDGSHVIPIGRLSFSPHGQEQWTGFSEVNVPVTGPRPPTGPSDEFIDLDYRLQVTWDDEPGAYSAILIYTIISL